MWHDKFFGIKGKLFSFILSLSSYKCVFAELEYGVCLTMWMNILCTDIQNQFLNSTLCASSILGCLNVSLKSCQLKNNLLHCELQILLGNQDQLSMTWRYTELLEVHSRWYQLQDTALEIFLVTGRTYLLSFDTMAVRTHPPPGLKAAKIKDVWS